ncbi:MAG TPA: hypothetical protein VFQ35_10580, partial [Polyangiaceae bacterium]|nr:hypothetical protein [Polyangiaceae bacterium]
MVKVAFRATAKAYEGEASSSSLLFVAWPLVLLIGAAMRDLRWLFGFLGALLVVGCGDDGGSGGSGGAGGSGGGGGAGACVGGGQGTLNVNIRIDTGVPASVTFKSDTG